MYENEKFMNDVKNDDMTNLNKLEFSIQENDILFDRDESEK